jgi:putative flippase GtrA
MFDWLTAFFSLRFLKFCTVGASGVLVNLLSLALFADILGVQVNLASALAIELSINSNFAINELWTFRDRRLGHRTKRWLKFHLVSLVGGAIQWLIFIGCNSLVFMITKGTDAPCGAGGGMVERYLIAPVTHPPDVGNLKYLSQLLGIGGATFWNYIANFYWTWARGDEAMHG